MSYKPGDYWACCDQCGFRILASKCRMQWNGLFTCPDCFDTKHPQEIPPTPRHEKQRVDISRPEGDPVFLNPGDVTPDDL